MRTAPRRSTMPSVNKAASSRVVNIAVIDQRDGSPGHNTRDFYHGTFLVHT